MSAITGIVGNGQQGALGRSSEQSMRLDSSAALVTTAGHGAYKEALFSGNCFTACNQTAVALTGLATTVTGFLLTNPASSGRNLVLIDCAVALGTAPAGITTLCYGYQNSTTVPTQTTPLTIRNAFLLGNGTQTAQTPAGVGLAASSGGVTGTPVAVRALPGGSVATGGVSAPFIMDPIDGKLVMSPGCTLQLAFLTTAVSALSSMLWEEVSLTGGSSN